MTCEMNAAKAIFTTVSELKNRIKIEQELSELSKTNCSPKKTFVVTQHRTVVSRTIGQVKYIYCMNM